MEFNSKFFHTILIYSALGGNREIVEILLEQENIDINAKGISNLTFFHDIEIFNDLWNSTPIFNWTALIWSAYEGHREIVELLLRQKDIDVNMKSILNQKYS